ncbi:MAG: TatD-like protein deoxyribonuclease, partial [Parcubacteria group bacterium GW2011_GWA1_49_11]
FARQYDDMIKSVPLERILLETDAPYLAPVPHRGKRNEPLFVVEVAKKLAEIKNLPLEQVIEQTALNTRKLFSI